MGATKEVLLPAASKAPHIQVGSCAPAAWCTAAAGPPPTWQGDAHVHAAAGLLWRVST
jgi:hypothetical protein